MFKYVFNGARHARRLVVHGRQRRQVLRSGQPGVRSYHSASRCRQPAERASTATHAVYTRSFASNSSHYRALAPVAASVNDTSDQWKRVAAVLLFGASAGTTAMATCAAEEGKEQGTPGLQAEKGAGSTGGNEKGNAAPEAPAPPRKKPMSRRKLARRNSRRRQRRHYPYVIIGGGTTAYAAIEAIRQMQPDADLLIISDEPSLPRADVDDDSEFFQCTSLLSIYNEYRRHISSRLESEPDAYSAKQITLLLGRRKLRLDAEMRTVVLQDGSKISYDKCLLASAGAPRDFYVLDNNQIPFSLRENINTLTKLQHFVDLDAALGNDDIEHLTVVGGGFLGAEMACSVMDYVSSSWYNHWFYTTQYFALFVRSIHLA